MKRVKIAITGAVGRVGHEFIFRLIERSPFSADVRMDLALLDIPGKENLLKGLCMELEDCASPYLGDLFYTTNPEEVFCDAHWVIFLGAVPRQPGMEARSELLKINGRIFAEQGKLLNRYANSAARVLMVGNPCNTNSLITMKHAPDISPDHFYVMSLLDEQRAKAQIALKAGCAVNDIHNLNVWGNHSITLYPDFYHGRIGGRLIPDIIQDDRWLKNDFIRSVQRRGTEITKTQGVSSAASAAFATWKTLFYLVNGIESGNYFTIGKYSRGEYGVDEGLFFSYPCYLKEGEVCVAENIEHNEFSQQKIQLSLNELREEALKVC